MSVLSEIYGRGLTSIPLEVEKALNQYVIDKLMMNGHGISFPDSHGCQMRFIRNNKDQGGYYSYSQFGGIEKAVEAAMSRNYQLKINDKAMSIPNTPTAGVTWVERLDSKSGKHEYMYRVFYKKPDGSAAGKSFYICSGNRPSADKQLHAYRTAKLFRHHYDIYGSDINIEWFKPWKEIRLYTNDRQYFEWFKMY